MTAVYHPTGNADGGRWSCRNCGPHAESTGRWCAVGCGRDHGGMTWVTDLTTAGVPSTVTVCQHPGCPVVAAHVWHDRHLCDLHDQLAREAGQRRVAELKAELDRTRRAK